MGYVVSFDGFTPPARFDSTPWSAARIYEAASPSGTGTLIDTVSLGAPDANPASPAARDFTTTLGTAPDRWYWAVFVDAALNLSDPTTPFQNTGTATAGDPACQEWITGDDVLDCCDATLGSDVPVDVFAAEATELLYELSGRRFSGICERTVRPCPGRCGCWPGGSDPLLRYIGTSIDGSILGGAPWFDGGYWWFGAHAGRRGCRPLSTVKLAGYPVTEIVEVLIDDAPVDPAGYELKNGRDLVRLNDADGQRQLWPGCQDTGQPSGPGTFFVTYRYGVAPPVAGVEAAKQLACQLAKACPSSGATDEDCDLPAGTVRFTRQGITVEAQALGLFLTSGTTGLAHVDAFLTTYGERSRRPATVWSPDVAPYAQQA